MHLYPTKGMHACMYVCTHVCTCIRASVVVAVFAATCVDLLSLLFIQNGVVRTDDHMIIYAYPLFVCVVLCCVLSKRFGWCRSISSSLLFFFPFHFSPLCLPFLLCFSRLFVQFTCFSSCSPLFLHQYYLLMLLLLFRYSRPKESMPNSFATKLR